MARTAKLRSPPRPASTLLAPGPARTVPAAMAPDDRWDSARWPGEVDEQLLARPVLLAHHQIQVPLNGAEVVTELTVGVAVAAMGPLCPSHNNINVTPVTARTRGARRAPGHRPAPSLGAAAHGRPAAPPAPRRRGRRAAPPGGAIAPPQANRRMARTLRMAGRSLGTATSSQRTPRDGDRPPQLARGPLRHRHQPKCKTVPGRRHCVPGSHRSRLGAVGMLLH